MKSLCILCALFVIIGWRFLPQEEEIDHPVDLGIIGEVQHQILEGEAFDVMILGSRETYRDVSFSPLTSASYSLSYKRRDQADSEYFRVPLAGDCFGLCFIASGSYDIRFVRDDGATEIFGVAIADRPGYDPSAAAAYIVARKDGPVYVFDYYLGRELYRAVQESTETDRRVTNDEGDYTLTTSPDTVMMKFLYSSDGGTGVDYFKYDYRAAEFVAVSAAQLPSADRIEELDGERIDAFTRPFSLPRTVTLDSLRGLRSIGSTLDRSAYEEYAPLGDPADVTDAGIRVTHQVWPYYELGFLVITDASAANITIPMDARIRNIDLD